MKKLNKRNSRWNRKYAFAKKNEKSSNFHTWLRLWKNTKYEYELLINKRLYYFNKICKLRWKITKSFNLLHEFSILNNLLRQIQLKWNKKAMEFEIKKIFLNGCRDKQNYDYEWFLTCDLNWHENFNILSFHGTSSLYRRLSRNLGNEDMFFISLFIPSY